MNGPSPRLTGPARLGALVLLLAGPVVVALQFWFASGASPTDWREPAAHVRTHAEPADAVVVEPHWNADPLPRLTEIGSQIRRQQRVLIGDLQGVDRIWLLSESDRSSRGLDRLPFEPSNAQRHRFGPVTVHRVPVPEWSQFELSLADRLADAEVAHVDGRGDVELECETWDDGAERWPCGERDPFIWVGRTLSMVGGDPHRCIWAHPPPEGRTLRIRFPDVPLGAAMRFRAGLSFEASLSQRGTPVDFDVSVGGEPQLSTRFPADETSWRARRIDTSERAGRLADVTVRVQSAKVFERYFCFQGWVMDGESARRLAEPHPGASQ